MADVKISELDAVSSLTGTEEFPVVQSGVTKKAAISDITAAPAGSDTEIQFNDSGTLGADPNLTFNSSTIALRVSDGDQGYVQARPHADGSLATPTLIVNGGVDRSSIEIHNDVIDSSGASKTILYIQGAPGSDHSLIRHNPNVGVAFLAGPPNDDSKVNIQVGVNNTLDIINDIAKIRIGDLDGEVNTACGISIDSIGGTVDLLGTVTVPGYVPTTRTVNGHALSSNVSVSASDVGLGSVTNDAQTKASIVPNTAPAPNVILIGNAGGTAYVPSTPAFPNASAASGKFIRSDGTNWIASSPSLPTSAGVAGKILRSDGTNYIESTPTYPNSGIAGTIIVSDGTNFVTSTPTFPNASASSGKFIRSDGTNWVASTPTLPTTAGVAGKVLYTNGTNYLESVPVLPVTAAAITGKIMQSDGTNWIASTATHPTAATLNKVVIGNGTNYVESTPAFPNASAITGKIIQSDGTNWIASTPTFPAAAGTNGNILVSDGTNFTSAARLMQQASGSSTSGTNGTIVARITAGAGNQLVGFTAFTDQTTTASTQTNINIVYSDGTFTTVSSAPNNAVQMFVNYAAILITQSAQFSSITALSAKKVTSINITTQNTGVGTRGAIISAEEIPIS